MRKGYRIWISMDKRATVVIFLRNARSRWSYFGIKALGGSSASVVLFERRRIIKKRVFRVVLLVTELIPTNRLLLVRKISVS